MTKVLTTKEYKAIEAKHSTELEMTLVKTRDYKLKPFGKFTIKWKTRQGHLPNIIPFDELHIKHDTTMPVPDDQDKTIIKFMKKFKTDILTDGQDFYTRASTGFTQVWHEKLSKYRSDESFKNLVDNGDTFSGVILNNL